MSERICSASYSVKVYTNRISTAFTGHEYPAVHPSWAFQGVDIYTHGLEAGEYPPDAESVQWPGGVRTVLPFLPSSAEVCRHWLAIPHLPSDSFESL